MDNTIPSNPTLIFSSENQTQTKPSKKYLIIGLVLFVIATLTALGLFLYWHFIYSYSPVPPTDRGYQFHQTVLQTFSRSDKYNSLIRKTDKAIFEKNQQLKYQLLTSLFAQLKSAYIDTKDPRILAAVYQLKNYTRALKSFKEEDFIVKFK